MNTGWSNVDFDDRETLDVICYHVLGKFLLKHSNLKLKDDAKTDIQELFFGFWFIQSKDGFEWDRVEDEFGQSSQGG